MFARSSNYSECKELCLPGIIETVVGHILVFKPSLEGHGSGGVMSQAAHDNEKYVLYSGQSCSPLA